MISANRIFKNSYFIVSAPRSGSTLLFNLLKESPDFWTVGGESHFIYKHFPHLRAENENFDSGCLSEKHADPALKQAFQHLVYGKLQDRDKLLLTEADVDQDIKNIGFLEKTPRNALNIPFLKEVFPESKFIFLYRDPRENIASIIEAWKRSETTGRQFVTFRDLPDWDRRNWALILPKGWRELNGKSLTEIATFQWSACNETIADELSRIAKNRWVGVSYSALLKDPQKQVARLCRFAQVGMDKRMKRNLGPKLPLSETVVTRPEPGKWRAYEDEILAQSAVYKATMEKIRAL